ncbi:MAG: hypothetical protein OXC91_01775 [Rhodobacteraceae bacterium]|nr:hypothetical protein [Paracoccaceae bacterium]
MGWASAAERGRVEEALAILNTVLPWDWRLRLGTERATPLATADIPHDGIHIRFTNGRADWPSPGEGRESWDAATHGIGVTSVDPAHSGLSAAMPVSTAVTRSFVQAGHDTAIG